MFGVSCPQTVVIATLLVARAVIMAGEIVPVFFFQVFHQITVDAELREQLKLLSLLTSTMGHPNQEFGKRGLINC